MSKNDLGNVFPPGGESVIKEETVTDLALQTLSELCKRKAMSETLRNHAFGPNDMEYAKLLLIGAIVEQLQKHSGLLGEIRDSLSADPNLSDTSLKEV